jgi:hypothetical protein
VHGEGCTDYTAAYYYDPGRLGRIGSMARPPENSQRACSRELPEQSSTRLSGRARIGHFNRSFEKGAVPLTLLETIVNNAGSS